MNSAEAASRWTSFLASHPEVPHGGLILQHFRAGTITRLCDCGCNSYELAVRSDAGLAPLANPGGRGGCVLSVAFRMRNGFGTIEFDIFADANGYLAGVDVSCNSNSDPVSEDLELEDQPYHVDGTLLRR
jgi:hypothetical protein